MSKRVPNKRHTGEFKQMVVDAGEQLYFLLCSALFVIFVINFPI